MTEIVGSLTSVRHYPIKVNIYGEGLLMGDEKGFQNINMVFTVEKVPHLSFFRRTEKKKRTKQNKNQPPSEGEC